MVEHTLSNFEYTFDASEKTITLISKYEDINLGAIVSIRDVTTDHLLYTVINGRDPITLSNLVITHTHGNGGQSDSDDLRIIIDMDYVDTDEDRILFNITSVPAGETIISGGFNIEGSKDLFMWISSTVAFTFYVQITGNSGDNPDWFDLCDASGTAYTYTTTAEKKCIPLTVKGAQMRVMAKNNGGSAEAPYCEVK